MSTRNTWRTLVAVIMSCTIASAMAGELRSSVSTNQVAVGDSFTLTLSSDTARPASTPDLAPLQEHFRILNISQQSQTSIINGRRADSFSWLVALSPNGTGKLTIPAITAGTSSSKPLTIEVLERAPATGQAAAPAEVSIEVAVEPGTHYVQQEIPVTVRIQDAVGIRDARLEEPRGSDFILARSGEDKVSQVTRDGRQATVLERHYLLKPQKSGALTIPPLTLVATVNDPSGRSTVFSDMGMPGGIGRSLFGRSMFDDLFSRGRQITARSLPVVVEVKPRPTGDSAWFLPAKHVELKASWDSPNPQFRAGETSTRTISLMALGAAKEQLPDIAIDSTPGARLYLERSRDKSVATPDGTAAIREFVVSVVPTRAGEVQLPAIEVKWWDTASDTEQLAILPAQTITAAAGAGHGTAAATTTPAAPAPAQPGSPAAAAASAPAPAWSGNRIVGFALLLSLLVVGLAAGVSTWFKRRASRDKRQGAPSRASREAHRQGDNRRAQAAEAERAFTAACRANELAGAYTALTSWLRLATPAGSSATSHAESTPPRLADQLAAMEGQLYSGESHPAWSGKRALAAFAAEKRALLASTPARRSANSLPALYPA